MLEGSVSCCWEMWTELMSLCSDLGPFQLFSCAVKFLIFLQGLSEMNGAMLQIGSKKLRFLPGGEAWAKSCCLWGVRERGLRAAAAETSWLLNEHLARVRLAVGNIRMCSSEDEDFSGIPNLLQESCENTTRQRNEQGPCRGAYRFFSYHKQMEIC